MKIFVCSPLRADNINTVEMNIVNVKAWCKHIAVLGHAPFAPHLFYTQFLSDEIPIEREAGIRCGLEFLKTCDALWYFGHTISSGMMTEIAAAKEAGIPVRDGFGASFKETRTEFIKQGGVVP